ncbi:MAG: Stp1/IreP family PP2C-type Ser/Thr phosphatase [Myxococcales bacterium]
MPTFEPSQNTDFPWSGGKLRIAGATDVGHVRRVNQDAYGYFCDDEREEVLMVVADGLGGHRGGEVASRMAIESLESEFRDGDGDNDPRVRLTNAIESANQHILTAARKDRTLDGMGTTIVCLLLSQNGPSVIAHVGDSRLYRLRTGTFSAMTQDHSLVATLLREGVLSEQEAKDDPRRNQILSALGVRDELEVEVNEAHPLANDRYLLCSDGLHGLVDDHQIKRLLSADDESDGWATSLIAAANRAGGNDNITCLVASLPKSTLFPALRAGTSRLVATTRSLFRKEPSK